MASIARDAPILGRFRVVEVIGRGSFGRVLQVFDAQAGETRVLKIVPRGPHEGMLLDEFEQLAKLRHPSLPRVFEVGRIGEPIADLEAGSPFFLAEWISGGRCDAADWSPEIRSTLGPRLWALLADVAGALATIHAAGLVHGDVAPQNILFAADGRAVLVDLGLATIPLSSLTGARGTPVYMAPEALAGQVESRSDLYGLGSTAIRLATGKPLFDAADLGQLVQRIVAGAPPPELPGVPRPLGDLIGRLVARDLDARPPSAAAVLDELDLLAAAIAPGSARRARPKVAIAPAPTAWPGAAPVIDALARGLDREGAVIAVVGPAAAGGRELVDGALRTWQLARVAMSARDRGPLPDGTRERIVGTLDAVAAALAVPTGFETALGPSGATRGFIERVARAARQAAAVVVFELDGDPRAEDLLAALARADGRAPVVALVEHTPATRPGLAIHQVPILDPDAVAALATDMLGRPPPRAWAHALHAVSAGHANTVIELVRSIAGEREPFGVDWTARSTAGAAELRAKQLRAVTPGARRIAAAIAAFGGRARIDRVLGVARMRGPADQSGKLVRAPADQSGNTIDPRASVGLAEIAELERAGLVRRRDELVSIDRATSDAVEIVAGSDALAKLAAAALADADARDRGAAGSRLPAEELAPLLDRVVLDAPHAALACDVAEELLARGRIDRATALAKRAIEIDPARAHLIAARAAAAANAYREAAAHARAAEAAGADRVAARLVLARAEQRASNLDAAEAALASLHAEQPDHAEVAGAYARLLVTRSRYADARAIAQAGGPLTGLRAEAAGLAAYYLGELDAADAAFAALEVGAAAVRDGATAGRASSLRGMVAQQRGHLGLASDRYREAVRRLSEVGELHAAATAELNLGTVLAERGRASDALPRLASAGRFFAELDATTELCAAELNHANALLAVGQLEDARTAADSAIARSTGAPHLRAFALLVGGDTKRRLGDEAGGLRDYRAALAIAHERGDAHAQVSAYTNLAEAGQHDADAVDVEALCASADDRDRWTLARARLALRDPAAIAARAPGAALDAVLALAHACGDVAVRAAEADRLERAFRGHALAAQLASRGRDLGFSRAEAEHARVAHAALIAATAPAFRAAIDGDPDLARLPGAQPPALATRAGTGDPHLRRLLTLSRRLNSEASVERILDDVIDTAIELTAAERGFLLLRQAGELAPVVSRNFLAGDLETSQTSVSRSIAERAAQTGEPVVTVDAGVDERFGMAASVAALRLRSVLVVPLRLRGAIIGCIYVDHRLRGGAFDDAAASVLGELADIAAIAIANARLTEDLQTKTRVVDDLNHRLSAELAERDAELVRVRADLPDRDRLRHRYERILGRSPAMLKMLDVVDRAAATSLPVVIVGESGTGKELVARALHDNGPRKAGPFVALNCSAVPEPLLESELFGHVRGAFTGADRDRRGLFEVADGGTVFLDEIADTSAAMQAKLLRVLQDGMIRRVGDTRTRQVDVRVVAASQQSLGELAATGRFREDLRYRLEVIAVVVPPLRERDGDISLLVEHMLAQLAPVKPPRLTRAALRALGQHRWPGNVRELENALARGVAMGGEVIDLEDLPDTIAHAAARPEPTKPAVGEDLRLKPALTATEQAYITAAMSRAKGNQTVAARLLGLSRFGLQKKLRRLAGDDNDDDPGAGDDT